MAGSPCGWHVLPAVCWSPERGSTCWALVVSPQQGAQWEIPPLGGVSRVQGSPHAQGGHTAHQAVGERLRAGLQEVVTVGGINTRHTRQPWELCQFTDGDVEAGGWVACPKSPLPTGRAGMGLAPDHRRPASRSGCLHPGSACRLMGQHPAGQSRCSLCTGAFPPCRDRGACSELVPPAGSPLSCRAVGPERPARPPGHPQASVPHQEVHTRPGPPGLTRGQQSGC